jgi:Trp operon repressor
MATSRRRGSKRRSSKGRFEQIEWPQKCPVLLGRVCDSEIVRRTGYSIGAVRAERIRRGIPPFRSFNRVEWTEERLSLLGQASDRELAEQLGISNTAVSVKRRSLGIPPYNWDRRPRESAFWTPAREALLGTMTDASVAARIGAKAAAVGLRRRILGIPPFTPPPERIHWKDNMLDLLGKLTDGECATRFGISISSIQAKRHELERSRAQTKRAVRPRGARLARALAEYGDYQLRIRFGITKAEALASRHRLGIWGPGNRGRFTRKIVKRLGKEIDRKIADDLGVSIATIRLMRMRLGIPALHPTRWQPWELDLLGRVPDREAAEQLRRTYVAVKMKRRQLRRRAIRRNQRT